MTDPRTGKPPRQTDRTIDRIDNTLGYVAGNVIAVCHAANQLKAVLENPTVPIGINDAAKMIRILRKKLKESARVKI